MDLPALWTIPFFCTGMDSPTYGRVHVGTGMDWPARTRCCQRDLSIHYSLALSVQAQNLLLQHPSYHSRLLVLPGLPSRIIGLGRTYHAHRFSFSSLYRPRLQPAGGYCFWTRQMWVCLSVVCPSGKMVQSTSRKVHIPGRVCLLCCALRIFLFVEFSV